MTKPATHPGRTAHMGTKKARLSSWPPLERRQAGEPVCRHIQRAFQDSSLKIEAIFTQSWSFCRMSHVSMAVEHRTSSFIGLDCVDGFHNSLYEMPRRHEARRCNQWSANAVSHLDVRNTSRPTDLWNDQERLVPPLISRSGPSNFQIWKGSNLKSQLHLILCSS